MIERLLKTCLPACVLVSIRHITVVAEDGSKICRLNMLVSRNLLKKTMLVKGFKGLKFVVAQTNGMMQIASIQIGKEKLLLQAAFCGYETLVMIKKQLGD